MASCYSVKEYITTLPLLAAIVIYARFLKNCVSTKPLRYSTLETHTQPIQDVLIPAYGPLVSLSIPPNCSCPVLFALTYKVYISLVKFSFRRKHERQSPRSKLCV